MSMQDVKQFWNGRDLFVKARMARLQNTLWNMRHTDYQLNKTHKLTSGYKYNNTRAQYICVVEHRCARGYLKLTNVRAGGDA